MLQPNLSIAIDGALDREYDRIEFRLLESLKHLLACCWGVGLKPAGREHPKETPLDKPRRSHGPLGSGDARAQRQRGFFARGIVARHMHRDVLYRGVNPAREIVVDLAAKPGLRVSLRDLDERQCDRLRV